jgi:hypothetical protein
MEMHFREFFMTDGEPHFSDLDVVNIYYHQPTTTIRELSSQTGKSIGEIYRILRRFGEPNRLRNNSQNVIALADGHLSYNQIADLTGYTTRHVRNILKSRD